MTFSGVLLCAKVKGNVDSSSKSASAITAAVTLPGARFTVISPPSSPLTPKVVSAPMATVGATMTGNSSSMPYSFNAPKSIPPNSMTIPGENSTPLPTAAAMETEMPSEMSTAQPMRYPATICPPRSADGPSETTEKSPDTLTACANGTPSATSPPGMTLL
nr:hypothetical protein [Nocardia asiatica]